MSGSNTATNSVKAPGRPFKPGDPRINRKGRPKSFDAFRELAKSIGNEVAMSGERPLVVGGIVAIVDGAPVIIGGHKVTKAEAILRAWSQSKDPRLQMAFIEIAYGKVPTVNVIDLAERLTKGYTTVSPDDWPDPEDKDEA